MATVGSICTSCNIDTLEVESEGGSFSAEQTLPKGMCFLAFHQIYPYIRTLSADGWFNWVGHEEHVIVKCPATNGIAVEVKAPTEEQPELLECQVIEKRGPCFRGHEMDDRVHFDVTSENLGRLETLYDLFPNLMNLANTRKLTKTIEYNVGSGEPRSFNCSVEFTKPI